MAKKPKIQTPSAADFPLAPKAKVAPKEKKPKKGKTPDKVSKVTMKSCSK